MKKLLSVIAIIFGILFTFAQAPERFSYQAVIRNASNALVANSPVGMKISILKTSAAGTVVYAETQTATTNVNGLVSIQIGAGTVVSGTIAGINWSNDSYYIKTETDPAGGTSYSIAGTTQLLSVPYALYSKNSGSGSGLSLPYAGTSSVDNVVPFSITNSSATLNYAGYFVNTNSANGAAALTGQNDSVGVFGTGVEGRANSNTNGNPSSAVLGFLLGTGTSGAGVFGLTTNAIGVSGSSVDGSGVRGYASGTGTAGYFIAADTTGKALLTAGKIKIVNNSEGNGKVLTSDASGNATWQDNGTPAVYISSLGGSGQKIETGGNNTVINSWTGLEESGGANYNPATGIYTIPVSGFYSVTAQTGFYDSITSDSPASIGIQKNGTYIKFAIVPMTSGTYNPFLHISMEMQLIAGDKIAIGIAHLHPTALFLQENLSGFSIHLIHK